MHGKGGRGLRFAPLASRHLSQPSCPDRPGLAVAVRSNFILKVANGFDQ